MWKWGFPSDSVVKNLPAMQEMQVQPLDWEDPLEEGMATHSNILARKIPWTEKPGGLRSTESQRLRHNQSNWATHKKCENNFGISLDKVFMNSRLVGLKWGLVVYMDILLTIWYLKYFFFLNS